mmetsp:Transcript_12694/g.26192  ORF Transcript_12694/g.26192 Transcript_12694/m.26192 type:complete len:102 (-) Transcript_12694:376-681(-)
MPNPHQLSYPTIQFREASLLHPFNSPKVSPTIRRIMNNNSQQCQNEKNSKYFLKATEFSCKKKYYSPVPPHKIRTRQVHILSPSQFVYPNLNAHFSPFQIQ